MTQEGRHQTLAAQLNQNDLRESLDVEELQWALARFDGPVDVNETGISWNVLRQTHPHLFAAVPIYVDEADRRAMARLIEAVERVVALPGWQARALADAPASARHVPPTACAFLGYDFHLGVRGPQLIEINTNAGGGLLCARLLRAQKTRQSGNRAGMDNTEGEVDRAVFPGHFDDADAVEAAFLAMFREEWRLARGVAPLARIAIIDDMPDTQFLHPEFLLFKALFATAGIDAVIADPRALSLRDGRLWLDGLRIDLVYNRLTDFSLDEPAHAILREAWLSDAAVITPHPHAHALYADKRNLVALSDMNWLHSIGVPDEDIAVLQAGVPPAWMLSPAQADIFWENRRNRFFKPAAGYAGRAAYRGDKLTRRVFTEIINTEYVAQTLVPPAERRVQAKNVVLSLKFDVRNFVYRGRIQLVSARLYQGQMTNLRTQGGGFAAVAFV